MKMYIQLTGQVNRTHVGGNMLRVSTMSGKHEDLFAEVGIEWCNRACAPGWQLCGTSPATILHKMGDIDLRARYFGWRGKTTCSSSQLLNPLFDWIMYPVQRVAKMLASWVAFGRYPSWVVSSKRSQ